MLKQLGWSGTSADGSGWWANAWHSLPCRWCRPTPGEFFGRRAARKADDDLQRRNETSDQGPSVWKTAGWEGHQYCRSNDASTDCDYQRVVSHLRDGRGALA